jgi:SAM-dependent methyltransferase
MDTDVHVFVARALHGRRRVLEVGCGRGELALRLAAEGHDMTALDLSLPDPPRGGARFVESDFLAYEDDPFDGILFTSSLHHIAPLAAAVDKAWALLAPRGLLVADEFDVAAPDVATARWFYGEGEPDPLGRWRAHHDHTPRLHTADEMQAALAVRFTILFAERGPYLHRYGHVQISPVGELAAIRSGAIKPVGIRFICEK